MAIVLAKSSIILLFKSLYEGSVIMELFKLDGFENYYITKSGKIFKKINDDKPLKEIKPFLDSHNSYRVNLSTEKGKYTTKQLHTLVYKTFKGDINSKRGEYNKIENMIVFIDGNIKNCSINNLMTVKELKEFYNNHNL